MKNMLKKNLKLLLKKDLLKIMLIALIISLLIIFVILFNAIHRNNYQNIFKQHKSVNELLFKHKNNGTLNPADINYIDYWMTFKYINTLFDLPNNYLKDSFGIANSKYPNISLSKYSATIKINRAVFVDEIKRAVGAYLEANKVK